MIDWKEAALDHAKVEDPRESVGLLLNVKGKERYYPCNNLSMSSYQCFVLDPEDYVKADSIGEITAIIHSHPITPPTPSQADLVSCENSNLPWHIVNPKTEQWGYCEPSGYKAPLLGREWVWGITDCWALVKDWYKENKDINLIMGTRPANPEEFIKNPMSEENGDGHNFLLQAGFRLLEPDEKLNDGDVLLMSILAKGLNHAAIFLDGDVLHHLADRLSCREPYSPWLLKCTGGRYRYVA
jgi:proteasome lid subunit RPN8/RPN11